MQTETTVFFITNKKQILSKKTKQKPQEQLKTENKNPKTEMKIVYLVRINI